MKVVKPMKLPVLTRVVERSRRPELHVAAMIGFPLDAPRALLDELAFWAAIGAALGPSGVIDEGFAKARGELLVAGSFHAPGGLPLTASYVRVKLGGIDKRLAILGHRVWQDNAPTEPEPMTVMPIDWAHAFGGARFDRNPYGRGIAPAETDSRAIPLPNVDHYGAILRSPSDRPEPAGFLPMDVTFAQRRGRAGTYDARWFEEHFPGLAPDAGPTFFNVAPEDQWIDGFFRGDEGLIVENMHPERPRIEGRLPGLVARCFVTHRTTDGERFLEIPMRWDTVWLFPSAGLGALIAHGSLPIAEDDAADVVHLVCACEDPATPRPAEHYQKALARRLDRDKGALAGLSDSDLMPPRTSGVAPNIGELDVGRWTKSEDIQARNMRRWEERRRAELRTMIEAEGLDPKDYGLAEPVVEPAAPPVDDPDALVAYVEAESAKADAKAQEAKSVERTRQALAEMGEDYDAMMKRASEQGMGPPKFSAAAHLEMLREAGVNDVESRRAELERQELGLREMYQRFGHLQPTAAAMDSEASERARVIVQLAIEDRASLANHDFTGVNLAGMQLAGIDLSGAFLEAADLSGCDLAGANLESAVLAKANLRGANLAGARLRGANLGGAALLDATLERADLTGAVLHGADLSGARCAGAILPGADWSEARLAGVDLSGAVLGQCNLVKVDLDGAHFDGADLSKATLVECSLDDADFSRATLEKTTFVGCKGERVSFREARLRQGVMVHGSSFAGADFRDADLEKANLRGTALAGARLDRANLAGADLSECDAADASFERAIIREGLLIRANLTGASLQGANLMDALASKARVEGADFTGTNLYRADLSRVVGDERTTFAEAEIGHVRFLPKASVIERGGS